MPELLVVPKLPTSITHTGSGANPLNVNSERLGRAFSWAGASIQTLVFDLGAVGTIDTLALLAHNLAPASQWRVYAAAAAANLAPAGAVGGGVPVGATTYASGWLPILASTHGATRIHRQALHYIAAGISTRYVRIDIDAATAGAVGRIIIGDAFTPLEGRDYGWDMRVLDRGETGRTSTGLDDTIVRGKVLEYSWLWSGLTEAEARIAALDILAYAGTTKDLLIVLDPTATDVHNLIGYGKLSEPAIATNYAEGWYELKMQLQSRLVLAL